MTAYPNTLKTLASTLLLVILLLFIEGCEYNEADPKAYPYQFQQVQRFSQDVAAIEPIHSDSLSDTHILVAHTSDRSTENERYIQIESPLGTPVIERYNLEKATTRPRSIPTYNWIRAWPQDKQSRWASFSTMTDTCQNLYLLDLDNGQRTELLKDREVQYQSAAGYLCAISVSVPLHTEELGTLIPIHYQTSPTLWRLRMMQQLDERLTTLFDIETGVQARPDLYFAGTSDTPPFFIATTTAPASGVGNDEFTDSESFVICWDLEGKRRWFLNAGGGGGGATVYRTNGNILVVRSKIAFSTDEETSVWLVDPETGALLDSATCSDQMFAVRNGQSVPEFVIPEKATLEGSAYMLNQFRVHSAPDVQFTDAPTITIVTLLDHSSNDKSVVFLSETTQSWILDDQWKPIGYIPQKVYSQLTTSESGRLIADRYLTGQDQDGRFVLMELVHVPWFSWWFYRYWLHLLVGVILPLAITLVLVWNRHLRLQKKKREQEIVHQIEKREQEIIHRREKRRQEILYKHKIEQVSRESTRDNSRLRTETASYLHSDVCGMLLYCGREIEDLVRDVDDSMFDKMLKLMKNVFDTAKDVRNHSHNMIPSAVRLEYPAMLRAIIAKYNHIYDCKLDVEEERVDFNPEVRLGLYMIIQDALNNIQKHAQASSIHVSCHTRVSPVRVLIEDDGIGIKESDKHQSESLGLVMMGIRMQAWGGTFNIRNGAERGTIVELVLPVTRELDEDTGVTMLIPLNTSEKKGS